MVAGGADAVLASYGTAIRFEAALAPVGLILRMDGGTTTFANLEGQESLRLFSGRVRVGQ